ncbi:MAG: nitrophenyl compound nitroreductase subunit ArsF family protein [Rikenellaceae bacterium]
MKRGIIALFALMVLASCGNATTSKNNETGCCSTETKATTAGTVKVLYMHGKQRCATCIAIGKEAESFIKGLGNDKVVMKTVDFSTPEGEKIADKYEIASSSLIVVKDGKVDNLTSMGFQYARNNPEQFKKNLSESIQKMLK